MWDAFGDDEDDDDIINNNDTNNNVHMNNDNNMNQNSNNTNINNQEQQNQVVENNNNNKLIENNCYHITTSIIQHFMSKNYNHIPIIQRHIGIFIYNNNNNHNHNHANNHNSIVVEQQQQQYVNHITRIFQQKNINHGTHIIAENNNNNDNNDYQLPRYDACIVIIIQQKQDNTTTSETITITDERNNNDDDHNDYNYRQLIHHHIIPGGYFIFVRIRKTKEDSTITPTTTISSTGTNDNIISENNNCRILLLSSLLIHNNNNHNINNRMIFKDDTIQSISSFQTDDIFSIIKWNSVPIQTNMCPWLPRRRESDIEEEYKRCSNATVSLSIYERQNGTMTDKSLQNAIQSIQKYGFCIISGLLQNNPIPIIQYGQAAINDLHLANDILQKKYNVSLFDITTTNSNNSINPTTTTSGPMTQIAPTTFRELSMREYNRIDIRYGPNINRIRSGGIGTGIDNNNHNDKREHESISISSSMYQRKQLSSSSLSLNTKINDNNNNHNSISQLIRENTDLLYIIRECMNPVDNIRYTNGNYGRYNFDFDINNTNTNTNDDQEKNKKLYQTLNLGPIGTIISWNGSADQALHADTSHLYEIYNHLPPHYMNIFTPAYYSNYCTNDTYSMGQTALISESHTLSFTAKYLGSDDDEQELKNEMYMNYIVRPQLQLGDVLLFDCRILHFGMSNIQPTISSSSSNSITITTNPTNATTTTNVKRHGTTMNERPIIYCNATMHWFHDPKNWNHHNRIFDDNEIINK